MPTLELTPDIEAATKLSHKVLVGKIIADKVVRLSKLKEILHRAWKIGENDVEIQVVARNIFIFFIL